MPPGEDEGVARRDAESVEDRRCELALQLDAIRLRATKRAVDRVHGGTIFMWAFSP